MAAAPPRELVRALGPVGATSLVVGTVIGTGVFLKAAVMAQLGGSPGWVLAAWAAAGLLSTFGAMTYAELGAMHPEAGGEYVYLRRAYGPLVAYLYAWNRFWIVTPGSIAAYAVGASVFLGGVAPLPGGVAVPLLLIGAFTALNCLDVRSSGGIQSALTALKVLGVLGLAAGALLAPGGDLTRVAAPAGFPGWSAFGSMLLAALWAYDGWNNLPMAAGEVRDPARTLPRAIVGGALLVFGVYALVHLGYFRALPFGEVASSSSTAFPDAPPVAAKVAAGLLGGSAAAALALAMTVSALSAMHGSMLTGARVPYAVARDGLAPAALGEVSAGARIPRTAVLVQGVLAAAFAMVGRFDQLTDAVVFASWTFYALNAGSMLLSRVREPDRERPFRVPGFPVVPVLFVAVAVALLVNTVITQPRESLLGLVATAAGAAVYAAGRRR